MSIQAKITSLLALIVAIFIVGTFYQFDSQNRSFSALLQDTKKQQVSLFDKLLDIEGKNIEVFVRDYTFWNEMVDFISSKDQTFAKENIDTGAETFGANVVEIYDTKRVLIYTVGNAVEMPTAVFDKLDQDRFIHFFMVTAHGVIEIRGATVHPTDDSERKTAPRGYFFAGRTLDEDYIQILAGITNSSVTILPKDEFSADFDSINPGKGYISFLRGLNGWDGSEVSYLRVEKVFLGISEFYSALSKQFWVFGGFLLLLTLLIYGFLSLFVARPLYTLSKSIRNRNIGPIEGMQDEKSEFGDLAGLVLKFSEHEIVVKEKAYDDAVLSAVGSGLVAINEDKYITFINKAGEKLLGISDLGSIGKRIDDVFRMRDDAGNEFTAKTMPFSVVMLTNKTLFVKFQLYRKDAGFFPVTGVIAPVIIDNRAVGAVMDFMDITEEKKVDLAKTEFVSLISHQLRTPLTIIGWYIERIAKLFGKGEEDKKFREYINGIAEANRRMVKLVNATVEVSRIELSHLNPKLAPIDLARISNEVIKEFAPTIDQKKISFEKKYEPDLPRPVLDERLVFVIIENILSNAVKYTSENGRISFSVSKDTDGVLISVADNGIGIPAGSQDKIFKKLFRTENARKSDPEGSGLGLYIAKAMAETLGGTIEFTSVEGEGATFYVKLPLSAPKTDINNAP